MSSLKQFVVMLVGLLLVIGITASVKGNSNNSKVWTDSVKKLAEEPNKEPNKPTEPNKPAKESSVKLAEEPNKEPNKPAEPNKP